jgi:large subunit ribosomal protein L15
LPRKGHKNKLGFEGGQIRLIRRLPKRGFNNVFATVFVPVNVGALARFDAGAEVTAETLRAAGLVKGRVDGVKILGDGALDKQLTVKVQAFSAGARAKIEAAGGTCEVVKN